MNKAMLTAIGLIVACGPAFAETTPKAAKEAGRPGQVLSDSDCTKLWTDAGGADLTADKAKPFVTNFEQVDTNTDSKITSAEFKEGCKLGFVNHAKDGSSTGAGSGTSGSETNPK